MGLSGCVTMFTFLLSCWCDSLTEKGLIPLGVFSGRLRIMFCEELRLSTSSLNISRSAIAVASACCEIRLYFQVLLDKIKQITLFHQLLFAS